MSGVYGREPAGINFPAGIPRTNSSPAIGGQSATFPPSFSGQRGLFSLILETVAKRSQAQNDFFDRPCPAGVVVGSCDNGHRFAKEVYCGREWCPVCNGKREDGELAPVHGRRVSRWYEKAQQINSMGYWVFTIPEPLRYKYRSKADLSQLGHQVQELLKAYGYFRGLRRWHWFGDRSTFWHPHLNVLVDGSAVPRQVLRRLRRDYSRLLGVKLAMADYHYLRAPGEKYHALKYVTRATFLDWRWDAGMAGELKGFRNQCWWGHKLWIGEPVWSLDDIEPGETVAGDELAADTSGDDVRAVACLERGECPECGLPIHWERFVACRYTGLMAGAWIRGGYWSLPFVRPPPCRLAPGLAVPGDYWLDLLNQAGVRAGVDTPLDNTWRTRFLSRHESFARSKTMELERESADLTLLADVDALIERHSRREVAT